MGTEDPSPDSEDNMPILHPDPEQAEAAARPPDSTPGTRAQ